MTAPPPRRIFAGHRVRQLRERLGLSQRTLAKRLGISVSYLSQIENDGRPITAAVLIALANAFPSEWGTVDAEEDTGLLVRTADAASDPTVGAEPMPEDAVRRACAQQPLLARRLVALHDAYRRTQDQLAMFDDRFASSGGEGGAPLPWEEARDWFHAEGNYVDALDRGAEALSVHADTLIERLGDAHGVRVVAQESADHAQRRFDPQSRTLAVDPSLAPESRRFLLAHQLVRLELADRIEAVIDAAPLRSPEARKLLSVGLANYAAGALLMPYAAFRAAAREVRHDIDRLRQRFGTSFEQTCHRLSTLQRPGAQGVPVFFCRVDMAGNITKRHSATRMQFARYGGACPLWIVHEAVAIPDRILVQLAETPDGVRYVSMAKGLVKPTASYLRPARRYAVALGCEVEQAGDFIYADQLELGGAHSATPIGVSCRICPRDNCDQRAFPPAGRRLEVDPDRRLTVPYSFR
ncbi:XRE family transcriptional regulator [Stakelama sediminis]|uniref:HTH cro/C1-type domain-containing protein n=1 Tax=Stakelama sediminis TaxID=463200 RepID=A0A840Z0T7_9SPHN|nr:helix-turn-helix transcriptional regulator [Stakelama sediminis]MBB5719344.1 hypothetical protein [Stakelama sediminis]